jgi:hypothetical protein
MLSCAALPEALPRGLVLAPQVGWGASHLASSTSSPTSHYVKTCMASTTQCCLYAIFMLRVMSGGIHASSPCGPRRLPVMRRYGAQSPSRVEHAMADPEELPDAPSLWSDDPGRPKCPGCGMRMITNIVESLRSFECLRCGHVEDEKA